MDAPESEGQGDHVKTQRAEHRLTQNLNSQRCVRPLPLHLKARETRVRHGGRNANSPEICMNFGTELG